MIQGIVYAGGAALLSGSFAVLPKVAMQRAKQQRAPVPRPVTAWWLGLGFVCASSVLALLVRQALNWWGLLSGLLWALSLVGRVACIDACGMATGNATPDITTIATSWLYDSLYNHERSACPPLGRVGILLLSLSLLSIFVLEQQGHVRKQLLASLAQLTAAGDGGSTTAGAADPHNGSGYAAEPQPHCPLLPHHQRTGDAAGSREQWQAVLWGLLMGVLSGACSGLSQLPFTLVPHGDGGVHFLLSSSLGVMVFASLNVLLHRCLWHHEGLVKSITGVSLHASSMAPWGLAGGMVLLAGTACGILAGGDEALDFSIAKALAKASVLVSGAWGVLLFHELRSLLQVLFWLLSLQMLCAYAVVIAARLVAC